MKQNEFNPETDKDGREIPEEWTQAMKDLYTETDAKKVLCHWDQEGLIGYWSKKSVAEETVFKIAREHDLKVFLTWARDGKAYIEFLPETKMEERER